jgi:hypothetical protein
MRLTLCQQAENHPDGTFSIVRGGLSHWSIDETISFVVFAEATPEEVPFGTQHAFTFSCAGCGADGGFAGYVGSPSPTASVIRFVLPPVELKATSAGTIVVTMKIGEHEAVAEITIKPSALS